MALHGSPASLHASPFFDKLFACPRSDPRVLFRTLLQSSAALAHRLCWVVCWTDQRHLRPLQPVCVEVILLPANTRHPALLINLSTNAIVLRVGHDPGEALLRLSAAVAAALGHVPHGQWALLDTDMPSLIDQSACLVEPVAV